MQMSTTTTFRDRSICCMQSKSITDKQYLLKKQKKIFKKKNIKNYIILGYKFEHAKVISKSAVYAREQKKKKSVMKENIYHLASCSIHHENLDISLKIRAI